MAYVTSEQPAVTAAMSRFDYSPALEKLYTFQTRDGTSVCLGERDEQLGHFWVPRGSCPIGKIDGRTTYKPQPFKHELELIEDQPECCAASLAFLKDHQSHILEAPTGWGKTVAGTWIACELGQPTLIVVPKGDLMDSWRESFDMAGIPQSMVGLAQGKSVHDFEGKRIVLGMVQSLMRADKFPPEFWRYFGLLIADETHTMAADCFSYIMRRATAMDRLGLSATPKRKDGRQPVVDYHIGPVKVFGKATPLSPMVGVRQTGYRLPQEPYVNAKGEHALRAKKHLMTPGRPTLAYQAIAADAARNQLLVRGAMGCYRRPNDCRHILMMSALTDHLWRLFHLFVREGVPPEEIGWYVRGDPKNGKTFTNAQLKVQRTKRIVLITDKMGGMGTNYPPWDTIVPCLPWPDVAQKVGRILRKDKLNPGKVPRVLDFVDADGMYQGYFKAREKYYATVGGTVKRLKPIT